jgi:hypothetical protein
MNMQCAHFYNSDSQINSLHSIIAMWNSKHGIASYRIPFAPAGAMSFSPSYAGYIFGSVYMTIKSKLVQK